MIGNLKVQHKAETTVERMLLKKRRRSKRAEVRESFSCECGKTYLSFSALYLHSKNKHSMKLTTKLSDEVCKVEKNSGLIKYCYFVKEQEESGNEKSHSGNIGKSGDESGWEKIYNQRMDLTQSQPQIEYFSPFVETLKSPIEVAAVESFLCFGLSSRRSENGFLQELNDLPYFLNDFLTENCEFSNDLENWENNWETACRTLFNLCEWMRETGLTELLVIPIID